MPERSRRAPPRPGYGSLQELTDKEPSGSPGSSSDDTIGSNSEKQQELGEQPQQSDPPSTLELVERQEEPSPGREDPPEEELEEEEDPGRQARRKFDERIEAAKNRYSDPFKRIAKIEAIKRARFRLVSAAGDAVEIVRKNGGFMKTPDLQQALDDETGGAPALEELAPWFDGRIWYAEEVQGFVNEHGWRLYWARQVASWLRANGPTDHDEIQVTLQGLLFDDRHIDADNVIVTGYEQNIFGYSEGNLVLPQWKPRAPMKGTPGLSEPEESKPVPPEVQEQVEEEPEDVLESPPEQESEEEVQEQPVKKRKKGLLERIAGAFKKKRK